MEKEEKKKVRKMTKFEIGLAIEKLPTTRAWTTASLATLQCEYLSRAEMVAWYNRLAPCNGLEPIV